MRLDSFLVYRKIISTRSKAHDWIKRGRIFIKTPSGEILLTKPSFKVLSQEQKNIVVKIPDKNFVSRAGEKLSFALESFKIEVKGMVCLDIGQSTGGFSDCMLYYGAEKIFGVEVGSGQLAPRIRMHPRVEYFENTHFENIKYQNKIPLKSINICTIDVSFISATRSLVPIKPFLKSSSTVLVLVKPQFEMDQATLKNGGINLTRYHLKVCEKLQKAAKKEGFSVIDYRPCPLKGRKGNQEFWMWLKFNYEN